MARRFLLGLITVLIVAACSEQSGGEAGPAADGGAPPLLEITIKPRAVDGEVHNLHISMRADLDGATPDAPVLRVPRVFASTPGVDYQVEDMVAADNEGPLGLIEVDDPVDPDNSIYFRRWTPARDVAGEVKLEYVVPADVFGPRETIGPPFNLMRQDGGFSGAGVTFMIVPDKPGPFSIAMRWDMSEMPDDSQGAWSMGAGDVDMIAPVEVVANAYYMAGPELRTLSGRDGSALSIHWMGDPDFDVEAIAGWLSEAYGAMASFYNTPDQAFRVFMRQNPGSYGGGGAGLAGSFMVGYGESEDVSVEGMQALLAHEMVHNWPGGLAGPVGTSSWYGEGMAEHYDPQLSFRAGLLTADEFIEDANARARGYYTNKLNDLPAEEISVLFWRDGRARRLPYQRGSLYLAQVDAQIRAVSAGERSLDDLALAMLARRDAGGSYDRAGWVELLRAELGDKAVAEFDAMMAGERLAPPSDAFGPCFERVGTTYPIFDLGFDPQILSMSPRIISGLQPGSAAARAGVRDGDVVTNLVPIDDLTEAAEPIVELEIDRDGDRLSISYAAIDEEVPGYRWVRTPAVPDDACNVWGQLPRT